MTLIENNAHTTDSTMKTGNKIEKYTTNMRTEVAPKANVHKTTARVKLSNIAQYTFSQNYCIVYVIAQAIF
jgi:hypothetical protein